MQKRGWLFLLGIFAISFVSAYWGYGTFSIADFFDSLDQSTVVYGLLFLIFFILIHMVLTKLQFFRDKRTGYPNSVASGIMSFAISALIVYSMYRSGYDLNSFFYEMGFSFNLSLVWVLLLIAAFAFVVWKFGLAGAFFALGGLLIASIFTNIIYEKVTAFFLGLGFIAVGFLINNWKKVRRINLYGR